MTRVRDVGCAQLVRSPLLQMLAIAGIVYLALPASSGPNTTPEQFPIQVKAADFESAVAAWEERHGTSPSEEDAELILDRLAADEALLRRALELGLDDTPITEVRLTQLAEFVGGVDEHGAAQEVVEQIRGQEFVQRDPIMRNHLIQTMKLLARKVDVPDQDELLSFYEQSQARFMRPAMYDFRQVYYSSDKRGKAAYTDAREGLSHLADSPEADPTALGDRFNAGSYYSMRPANRIQTALGQGISTALETAPLNQWIGPVESPYGWHLLRVENSVPAQTPQLATISSEVVHAYLQIRGKEKLARTLRSLRLGYGVELDLETRNP